MPTHQKEHCQVPNPGQTKKARTLEGSLWACDCGKVFRYSADLSIITTTGQRFYEWREFDYYSK